jgi:hypothetical protein
MWLSLYVPEPFEVQIVAAAYPTQYGEASLTTVRFCFVGMNLDDMVKPANSNHKLYRCASVRHVQLVSYPYN